VRSDAEKERARVIAGEGWTWIAIRDSKMFLKEKNRALEKQTDLSLTSDNYGLDSVQQLANIIVEIITFPSIYLFTFTNKEFIKIHMCFDSYDFTLFSLFIKYKILRVVN
jgi:hypothetical protein